jgi:hypothetical protein
VGRGGYYGQAEGPDVLDCNVPPDGQPGFWCQWVPTDDGGAIEWSGGEKFYDSPEWMQYIIDHFIGSSPLARQADPEGFGFLQGHACKGEIQAEGEEAGDIWRLYVRNNKVTIANATISFTEEREV